MGDPHSELEEGEIFDDYEIISSDEEFILRQRIEELEAKNKEFEQIARLSHSFPISYNYSSLPPSRLYENFTNFDYIGNNGQAHLDASSDALSTSSTELICSGSFNRNDNDREYKRKSIVSRRSHEKYYNEYLSVYRNSNKHIHYMTERSDRKFKSNHDNSPYYSKSKSACRLENGKNDYRSRYNKYSHPYESSDNYSHLLSTYQIKHRPETYTKKCITKKSRRKKNWKNSVSQKYAQKEIKDMEVVSLHSNDEEKLSYSKKNFKDSLREKQHYSKDRRNYDKNCREDNESAYSPSDFEDMLNSGILDNDVRYDTEMDLEIDTPDQTSNTSNSPIHSPKIDSCQKTKDSQPCLMDNKPIDMEISEGECSEQSSSKWSGMVMEHHSLQMNSTIMNIPYDGNDTVMKLNTFGTFTTPVMSIVNTAAQLSSSPLVPSLDHSPPSSNLIEITPADLKYYKDVPPPCRSSMDEINKQMVQEMEIEPLGTENQPIDLSTDEEDEEELALRALLLAKIRSSKNRKHKLAVNTINNSTKLKSTTMEVSTTKIISPTEISLMKAVRRLKEQKNQNDLSVIESSKREEICQETNIITRSKKQDLIPISYLNTDKQTEQIKISNSFEQNHTVDFLENNKKVDDSKIKLNEVESTIPLSENKQNVDIYDEASSMKLQQVLNEISDPLTDTLHLSKHCINFKSSNKLVNFADVKDVNKKINTLGVRTLRHKLKVPPKTTNNTNVHILSNKVVTCENSFVQTLKIVKPNKVINQTIKTSTLPTKPIVKKQAVCQKNLQTDDLKKTNNEKISKNPRLVTTLDQIKPQTNVPKLIIHLKSNSSSSSVHSSSESDSVDNLNDSRYIGNGNNTCKSYSKHYDGYGIDISNLAPDNNLPSTSTSIRITDPTIIDTHQWQEDKFEEKINCFLRNMRSKVQSSISTVDGKDIKGQKINSKSENFTPLAVRHLPPSAQVEYRRLIYRMKVLENQRKSSDKLENTNKLSLSKENVRDHLNTVNLNLLKNYENLYDKTGTSILRHLSKSLQMVNQAKYSKYNKLRLEKRISMLREQIILMEHECKQHQSKMSEIFPFISKTNEIITSLKEKRCKLYYNAIKMGKNLKGNDYRLNNQMKRLIHQKSKQLIDEIKFVNSLKQHNFEEAMQMHNNAIKTSKPDYTNLMLETSDQKIVKNVKNIENDDDTNDDIQQIKQQDAVILPIQPDDNVMANKELQDLNIQTVIVHQPLINDIDVSNEFSIPEYISPLIHFRNTNGDINPLDVLCPYDLTGQCEDTTCKFSHLGIRNEKLSIRQTCKDICNDLSSNKPNMEEVNMEKR